MRQLKAFSAADVERLRQSRAPSESELFEGEGGTTWAVAYADLLMVLMSFFIIFFSMSESGVDRTMYSIALRMRGVSGQLGAPAGPARDAGGGDGSGEDAAAGTSKPGMPAGLLDLLKKHQVRYLERRNQVAVLLDENAFAAGRFGVGRPLASQLRSIAEALVPFKDAIEVTVVGHADAKRLVPRNEYLRDNFDLSSLRAREAMRVLMRNGIPEESLMIQGASSNEMAARSLTLKIRRKGDRK